MQVSLNLQFRALTASPLAATAAHPYPPVPSTQFPIEWHSARTLTAGYSPCRELSLSQDPFLTLYRSETSLYTDKTTKSSTINANSTREYSATSQLIIRLYTYKNVNILYFTAANGTPGTRDIREGD